MHNEEAHTLKLYVHHLSDNIKEEKSDSMCNVSTVKT